MEQLKKRPAFVCWNFAQVQANKNPTKPKLGGIGLAKR